jgi:ubiquinone/menaquinone biosynthesis C-methylase UbiE
LTSSVCRRAFSSPEALGYEALISPAVLRLLAPQIGPEVLGRQVLDVGCGAGGLGGYLRRDRGAEVVGVDPSMAQSRRTDRSGGIAVRATADGLPFRDASFETVVSSCAIKHWPEPVDGLSECARVLRLARLTPEQRDVVALRFVADLPVEAVARITHRSVGAVKAMQHRALAQLAQAVSREAQPTL